MGRRGMVVTLLALCALVAVVPTDAAVKTRTILVVPFDTAGLTADDAWIGEGVAQTVALGLVQSPAFVQVDRARLRAFGTPEAWGEAAVLQAARSLRVDAALYGRVTRPAGQLVLQPRILELKGGSGDPVSMEPVTVGESDLLVRLAALPTAYARTLKVALTDAEARKIERAAAPTKSARALELFSRAQMAAARGGQEANESAVDLLSRAIEVDANFVVAQYTLGAVHQALGNRWKAAAQFRAATQIDPTQPEPLKALGDLFLAAPRRLYDQAVEAYTKA
ncbi:MAG TPA: hypothetical protein VGT02_06560, partial [Methylomirabilota bacterium]|nr:hypothetical protein [Methylomirabilota bacterium]